MEKISVNMIVACALSLTLVLSLFFADSNTVNTIAAGLLGYLSRSAVEEKQATR